MKTKINQHTQYNYYIGEIGTSLDNYNGTEYFLFKTTSRQSPTKMLDKIAKGWFYYEKPVKEDNGYSFNDTGAFIEPIDCKQISFETYTEINGFLTDLTI